MAMEFLVHGAVQVFGQPGVFVAFKQEQPEELTENVKSLGFDLTELIAQRELVVEFIQVETRSRSPRRGNTISRRCSFGLEPLSTPLRAPSGSCSTPSRRFFGGLSNHGIVRAELQRLFRWLKERGVTAVITCERGEGTLTRHGIGGVRQRLRHPARSPHH